jgi:membrane-associated protease RseP (regulator of RpoE activity)
MCSYIEYEDKLEKVKSIVNSRFKVEDLYYEYGVLTFVLSERNYKEDFKKLVKDLKEMDLIPIMRKDGEKLILKIDRFIRHPIKKTKMPYILFIVTILTTFIDGILRSTAQFYEELIGPLTPFKIASEATLFTIAVLSIFGLHELSHKYSSKKDGIDTSLPYFIPGIPGHLPTYGAVILQREPVVNRDDLFDMGFSGPLISFLMTIIVGIFAFLTALPASLSQIERWKESGYFIEVQSPLLFYVLGIILSPFIKLPTDERLIPTPLGFAAWLGSIVTALNLLPIWQLDGGRVFRSFLSRKKHKIASYIAIIFMSITGYWLMALLLLFMMPQTIDIPPLDEYSPLSKSRKIALSIVILILILTYVPMFPILL